MTTSGKSNQGEGSVGRGLPDLSGVATSWRQAGLFPSSLVQVRLDVGWDADHRVGMFAAEAFVPTTKELLAMEVVPSTRYDSLQQFCGVAGERHVLLLTDLFDPDPF